MRLINVETIRLHEYHGNAIPDYVILSHTWGDEEVTFQDWQRLDSDEVAQKAGFVKIQGACAQASLRDFKWLWIGTNCIDKSSSAELSEAINSMFQYYEQSELCFAYLSDVPTTKDGDSGTVLSQVANSRWFQRGWALQELLAPKNLIFFAADWTWIGEKQDIFDWGNSIGSTFSDTLSGITGIDRDYLFGGISFKETCIANKMSWLSRRMTTRVEDMTYCMLGIFNINMPLLYGEGEKAFIRLQEEIIKTTNDHTIFCWTWTHMTPRGRGSLLAPSPIHFKGSGGFVRKEGDEISVFSMTNAGLSIRLPVVPAMDSYFLVLEAASADMANKSTNSNEALCVPVKGKKRGSVLYVSRTEHPKHPAVISRTATGILATEPLLARNRPSGSWVGLPNFMSPLRIPFIIVSNSKSLLDRWKFSSEWEEFFDPSSGTILVEVKQESPGTLVGSHGSVRIPALVTRDLESNKSIRAYIFVGFKCNPNQTILFTQLLTRDAPCELTEQFIKTTHSQHSHFSDELGMSVVIDKPNNTLSYPVRLLHLSEGRGTEHQDWSSN